MKRRFKAIVACLFFSSFSIGYTSKISVEKLVVKFNTEEYVYAAPNVGRSTRKVFKFLGTQIIERTTEVIVENVLFPEKLAPPPTSQSRNPSSRLTYVGSYFQCAYGCKYFWSRDTGWEIFYLEDEEWGKIRYPSRTVVRTHNIYVSNKGEYILRPTKHEYGFDPRRGWVFF